jgi:hypothetical protein
MRPPDMAHPFTGNVLVHFCRHTPASLLARYGRQWAIDAVGGHFRAASRVLASSLRCQKTSLTDEAKAWEHAYRHCIEANRHTIRGANVRKVAIALFIAATVILSGISATTFSSAQLTSNAWANGGD